MRKRTTILISLAIVLCIAALYHFDLKVFSLFELAPQQNAVTTVYFADHISPGHLAVIERFNQKYKNKIEVVPVNLPFNKFSTNERKELLARSLRSKSDRLDVFSVDYIWTQRFAKWCEPLDAYFSDEVRNDILSPTLQSCLSDGKLVAMPLYIDVGMMYYRKDFLEKLPDRKIIEQKILSSISWSEMKQLRRRIGKPDAPFYLYQANDYEGLICNYFEMIASFDKNFFKNNNIDLRKPAAKQALQMLVDLVHKEKMSSPDVTEFDENKSYSAMLERGAMFVRGWPNFLENFQKEFPEDRRFQSIGRAPLPHFDGHEPTSVYGGWNLMVSKFSTKKNEAIEFVRFLQTEEAQKIMFDFGGYIPVNRKVYLDSAYIQKHEHLMFYRSLVDRGFHRPFLVDYTRISDIIAHFVHLAIKKEIGVDEALEQASTMITKNQVLIK